MKITLQDRTEEHVRIYFEKAADPEIRNLLPQKAKTVEEAVGDFYLSITPESKSFGRTIYADGVYVGDIWCYCIAEEEEPDAMVSYCIFDKHYWNQGIATYAAALFLKEVKEKFQLQHIGAFTYAENLPSIRVLKKNGFILKESFTEDERQSVYLQKDMV